MSSLQREFNQRVEAAKAAKADAAAQQKSRKKSQNISTDLSEGEMADILGELLTSGKYDNLAPFYSENKTSGNDVLDYMAGISGPDYSLYDAAFAAIRRGKTPPDEFFANFKQADYEKWLKKQLGFDEYSLLDSLMAAPAAATAPSSTNAAAPIGTAGVPDDRDAAQIMIGVGEALPTAGKTAVQNGDLDAQIREAKTAQQMAQRSRDYRKASEYEQLIEDLENQKRTGKDGVPAGTVGAVDASQSRKTRVAVPEQYAAQQDAKQPEMDALEQRIKEAKTAQHMALQNGDHEKAEEYKQLVKDLKDQQKVEKQAQEAAQRQAIHEYMSSPEIQAQLQSETGYKSFGDDWIRWNELATLPSLNKEERKEAKAAVNDILEKYPYMQDMRALEYSPSIVELYSYLKAKSNPGAGFGAGFGNALGIPWLTDRLIPKSSVESLRELQRTLSGEEPPAWVSARQFNAEIAQAHPTASTTGSMAANVLMLGGASALAKGGTGLIKGFSKLAPWVQRAVNSGLSFGMKGGYQALARTQTQEEWDAAEQQKAALSGGQYILFRVVT